MHKTKSTIEQACRELAPLGHIDCRSQFGGYSLSVDKVVFALISEGELYLRACEEAKQYLVERQMEPLLFDKKGIPVILDYYLVDETLWQQ
ncbi:MAG: Protein Sxy [Candidatus Erwinia impunctatus]|nr:Protein Sxy [Culicoides impunctatus]